jgi:hypothetical protein
MPSIINASSTGSGGIVQTADASGVLQLQSNGTVALNIDTSANVIIGATSGSNKLVVSQTKATTSAETYNLVRLTLGGTRALNDTIGIRFGAAGSSVDIGAISCVSGADDALYGTLKLATRNYNTDTLLDALIIDNRGRVTIPYQPSFLAVANVGDTTVTAGNPIPLNVAAYNVGSCYNTSTYRFTAPVAGKYLFNSVAYYTSSGGNTQSMQCAPFVNGSQYIPSGGGDAVLFSAAIPNTTGVTAIGGSVILNLAANDYVTMAARSNNGRFYLGHTCFSGQLIS